MRSNPYYWYLYLQQNENALTYSKKMANLYFSIVTTNSRENVKSHEEHFQKYYLWRKLNRWMIFLSYFIKSLVFYL